MDSSRHMDKLNSTGAPLSTMATLSPADTSAAYAPGAARQQYIDPSSPRLRTYGPPKALDRGSTVVHLVGRVTEAVFSALGPTTNALAERCINQTVVLLDESTHRHLLPRFHPSVRLVLVPADTGMFERMRNSIDAFCEEVNARPTTAVHIHGFVPFLLALYAGLKHGLPATRYFSPHHGSRILGRLKIGAVVLWLLRPLWGKAHQHAIVSIACDAKTLALTRQPVGVVENPVDAAFFAMERHEARRPLIVTGTHQNDPSGAALFAQLAVLLSEEELGLSFNWVGAPDPESLSRLKAADVGVFQVDDPQERASRLSAGWMYIAPMGSPGFPAFLAEAMAAGLPCVAWDTPYHRDLLRHGDTGFLCRSEADMLTCIARLIDSEELRSKIGRAAREEASRRFDGTTFSDSLFAAYQAPLVNTG
jgi:glycosyltransferase involved in cell wall biosynthesis